MAKAKTIYTCTECGGQTLKWQGQCPHCRAWNTLVETIAGESSGVALPVARRTSKCRSCADVEAREEPRRPTGIGEFDRVLGGGLVQGAVVLVGGDPGIGKSTLLLQALAMHVRDAARAVRERRGIARAGRAARAARLGCRCDGAASCWPKPARENPGRAGARRSPRSRSIDSVQTVYRSAAVRARSVARCANARRSWCATPRKPAPPCSWSATSPRRARSPARACSSTWSTRCCISKARRIRFRVLRAFKNRFGAVNELGVFAMAERGLQGSAQSVGDLPVRQHARR